MAQGVSIGTAWSEAAAFAGREKRLLAPLVLATMVVPATVSQMVQPATPLADAEGFQPWMAVAILALLAGLVGQMAVSRLAMGWSGSLGQALTLALKRLPTALAALFLYFLCVSLILIPVVVGLVLTGGGSEAAGSLANALSILFVVAATPRILLAPAIAMDRQIGPWTLVVETWRATRGSHLRLLGFFLLFLAASLILALAASAVVGSIAALTLGAPEPMSVSRLVIALAAGLVQGVVATVYAAMIGRLVAQVSVPATSGT